MAKIVIIIEEGTGFIYYLFSCKCLTDSEKNLIFASGIRNISNTKQSRK